MSPLRIGIDLGGSKIEAIALDVDGKILYQQRTATPAGDYEATLTSITALVTEAEKQIGGQASLGIGTPGSISTAHGVMRNANSTCLNGMPLKQDLEQRMNRPIHFANDADCFALSEAIDGAGQGAKTVFGAILGTGVGGGIVINKQLLSGINSIAGEWGHNPLPWIQSNELPGPICYCGKQGCIETFLSGPGLSLDYQKSSGETLNAEEIAIKAESGDALAECCLSRYEDRLCRALSGVINLLDPDIIVLGGGLSNLSRLYENIPRKWQEYIFSDQVSTRLVPPIHGDSSGVRGAAWLWPT